MQRDGPRGLISGVWHTADKWKGEGKQRHWMINAKAIMPIGDAKIDAYFSHSDRAEQDYQDLSLDIIARLGYDWDNYFPDYALAVRVADIGANRGDTGAACSIPAAGTVYPGAGRHRRRCLLRRIRPAQGHAGCPRPDGAAGRDVTFRLKGYYHENDGQGTWGTPYVASPNGVPMSVRTTEYDIEAHRHVRQHQCRIGANDDHRRRLVRKQRFHPGPALLRL